MKKVSFYVVLGLILRHFVRIGLTTGSSMEPTISDRQPILVHRFFIPKINDLVVFKNRSHGPKRLLKRIVALEGDMVKFRFSRLYVNGQLVKEPYLKELMRYRITDDLVVPKNHVYVLGDNRNNSMDSRQLGPIPKKDVIGVVVYGRK